METPRTVSPGIGSVLDQITVVSSNIWNALQQTLLAANVTEVGRTCATDAASDLIMSDFRLKVEKRF